MHKLVDNFGAFARLINSAASSPAAMVVAFAIVVTWAVTGPHFRYSVPWQIVMNTLSAVTTFLMVFILNNAQNRDTAAINAKLDSVILAMHGADNSLIGLEDRSDSQTAAVLQEFKATVDGALAERPEGV